MAHQPQILSRKSIPAEKFGLQIASQIFHHRLAPAELLLLAVDGLADFPAFERPEPRTDLCRREGSVALEDRLK
jgi:hypothetical protein